MANVSIETQKPVAYDSPDHLMPWGTAADNSTSRLFNWKLFTWRPAKGMNALDIGCSGGGFVKSLNDAGAFAVGVEGSDYSKKHACAEWATIPDRLFTADATEPFQLSSEDGGRREPMVFDMITAWEFFEHIAEDRLDGVVANIVKHLAPSGVVIVSIAPYEDVQNGVRLHQTVKDEAWWVSKFAALGLERRREVEKYFGLDWVRGGPGMPSFTLALSRPGAALPNALKMKLLTGLFIPYEIAHAAKRRFNILRHNFQTRRAAPANLEAGRPTSG